jgi:hypothetical protein
MAGTVRMLIRALAGVETGRECRWCEEPIGRDDRFGMSEGVCRPCRAHGSTEAPYAA